MRTLSFSSRLAAGLLAFAVFALLHEGPIARAESGSLASGARHRGAGEVPRDLKEQALAQLGEARDAIDAGAPDVGDAEKALDELDDAIEELEESLDARFWAKDDQGEVDPLRLDPDDGHQVFHAERHTAQEIFDAIREGEIENADLQLELNAIVDLLVRADRRLADVAIQDAESADGEAEDIDEAHGHLDTGDALVQTAAVTQDAARVRRLLYHAMDGSYRHAWELAIHAVED